MNFPSPLSLLKYQLSALFFLIAITNGISQTLQTYFPETNDKVTFLKRTGDTLFVLGEFTTIDSIPRNYLCAVEISTGNVLPWDPNPNFEPKFMEISNNRLIIAGPFSNISGVIVQRLAVYTLPSLQLLSVSYAPNENFFSQGFSIFSNYLYYTGYASHIPYEYISRFDLNLLAPDTLFRIPANFNSYVTLLADSDYVYVAGDLNNPGGINNLEGVCRYSIANQQIDTTWTPNIINSLSPWTYALGKYNNHIYLGGSFSTFGGLNRNGIVEIDMNGNVTNKNFLLSNSQVHAIAFQGNTIWIGTNSANIGGAFHPRVSQVDINTGYSTCWYPASTGQISGQTYVSAIEVNQDTVFLGAPILVVNARHLSMFTGNPSYINIGPDQQICPAAPFTLNAAQGIFNSFIWNTGASTPSITSTQPGLFWVTANDTNGCAATDSVMVDFCTAIPTQTQPEFVQFLSAQAKELHLNLLTLSQLDATSFNIYSIDGRLVKEGLLTEGQNIVSLPELSNGLFICKVNQKENTAVFRFFIGQ
jgi:hypothetical protein